MSTFQTSDVKLTENILWLLIIHSVYRYFPSQYRPRPKEPITQNVPRITNCVLLSTWLSFQIYQGSLKNQLASSCYGTWEDESVVSFCLAYPHLRMGLLEDRLSCSSVYVAGLFLSFVTSHCLIVSPEMEDLTLPNSFLFKKIFICSFILGYTRSSLCPRGLLAAAPRLSSCSPWAL